MDQYIIAHDVGTSGNKAVLVRTDGRIHGKCSAPFQVHYPMACRAEQEPADWWKAVVETTRGLLAQTGVSPSQILCVTHCTQLLGIVPMSAKAGSLGRAIIWLDSRASSQAQRMMRKFIDARVFALIAGSPLCGKDCIPKLLWLKSQEPDIYNRMCCSWLLSHNSLGMPSLPHSAVPAIRAKIRGPRNFLINRTACSPARQSIQIMARLNGPLLESMGTMPSNCAA